MDDIELAKKLSRDFQDKTSMATLIHNVAGHDWGWFSREDQRLHLQTVEGGARVGPDKVRVWLENKGKRVFELATGSLSGPDLRRLKAKVDSERPILEAKRIGRCVAASLQGCRSQPTHRSWNETFRSILRSPIPNGRIGQERLESWDPQVAATLRM
jgi:hypothetical protein